MNAMRWARAQWDRVCAGVLFAGGALTLVLGWVRVSQEALTAAQVPYVVSGGLGGIFMLGLGAVLWLSADLRDEWRKLDDIERLYRAQLELPHEGEARTGGHPSTNGSSAVGVGDATAGATPPARRSPGRATIKADP